MSRIGKQPIAIPDQVQIEVTGHHVQVKGPKGTLAADFSPSVTIEKAEKEIRLSVTSPTKMLKTIWGTTRALLANMILGVSAGFTKQLEIQGVGYKAKVQGKELTCELGFTNPCVMEIPAGLTVAVEKNIITVSGSDKQVVGEFAAQIRKLKPPEPYKGKGIRYVGEHVIRKEGKRSGGAEGK